MLSTLSTTAKVTTDAAEHSAKQPVNRQSTLTADRKANNYLRVVDGAVDCKAESSKRLTPTKPKNEDRRTREYLTEDEVKRLREAASKTGRHGSRDSLIILLMYRHGLRVSELTDLKWNQIDFEASRLHVRRVKGSESGVHPIQGDELRALRKMQRDANQAPWVFISERKGPLSSDAIQKMIARAGEVAGLGMPIHPHMLRHACGYELANRYDNTRLVQDWLGHRNIQNTVIYSKLSDKKFAGVKLGG